MDTNSIIDQAVWALLFFIPFLFALCFHEFAHGWVALKMGDPTAKAMGRLNLNPLSHADPIGTFLFPLVGLFSGIPMLGWAKPVPVDERNLRDPRRQMFWIASAGPLSNILLAFIGALLKVILYMSEGLMDWRNSAGAFLQVFIEINLILALFNLIPVHPLDGGKVIARFIPHQWNRWLEDNQTVISIGLIVIVFAGGFSFMGGIVRFYLAPAFQLIWEKVLL